MKKKIGKIACFVGLNFYLYLLAPRTQTNKTLVVIGRVKLANGG